MGYKDTEFEYRYQRDTELIKAYNTVISDIRPPFTMCDVLARAVKLPCSRFWVSETRAKTVIARMKHGYDLSDMKPNKRKMFQEIYRRVEEQEKLGPVEMVDILESGAPEFYLTTESAKVIIHYAKKRWLDKKLKQLRFYW